MALGGYILSDILEFVGFSLALLDFTGSLETIEAYLDALRRSFARIRIEWFGLALIDTPVGAILTGISGVVVLGGITWMFASEDSTFWPTLSEICRTLSVPAVSLIYLSALGQAVAMSIMVVGTILFGLIVILILACYLGATLTTSVFYLLHILNLSPRGTIGSIGFLVAAASFAIKLVTPSCS